MVGASFQCEKENNNKANNGRAFSTPQGNEKWTPFVLDHAVVIVCLPNSGCNFS